MDNIYKSKVSTDENLIKRFSELTGLSEQTLSMMIMYKSLFGEEEHPNTSNVLNAFLESRKSTELISYLTEYINKVKQQHQNYTRYFTNLESYENTNALFADYPVSLEQKYHTALFMASQCLVEFAKSQVEKELEEIDKLLYE